MTEQNVETKQRIDWVDCAKGIAILLVVFSHTIGANFMEETLRGVIFSFHMPLFFILSSMTFKLSTDGNEFLKKTENAFRHLVIPALALFFLRIIYDLIANKIPKDLMLYIGGGINKLIYASGVSVTVGKEQISSFGMLWFLVALFFSRTMFDYLHLKFGDSKKLIISVIICSAIGVIIGKIQWLPFDLDIVLAILPFMWFGNFIKKIDFEKKVFLRFLISFLIFCVLLFFEFLICKTYMELACRRYPIFPISFVTALAGTMFISYLSQILQKVKIFTWLNFLGLNSFLIFAIHSLDYIFEPAWKLTKSNIVNGLIRCAENIAIMFAIYFLTYMIKNQKKIIKGKKLV